MERGNDLLIAGVAYLAINMARWWKRRPNRNKLYLDVLSGIVIRDARAFTEAKNKSSKQKHFAELCSFERFRWLRDCLAFVAR